MPSLDQIRLGILSSKSMQVLITSGYSADVFSSPQKILKTLIISELTDLVESNGLQFCDTTFLVPYKGCNKYGAERS